MRADFEPIRFLNYINESNLDQINIDLDMLNQSDTVDTESVNIITSKISQILVEAAEHCNMIKKKTNLPVKSHKNFKTQKPWFNKQSELKRKNYQNAKRIYKKLNSRENYDNLVTSSREYKKLINKQMREYNSSITNKLKLMKNSDPKSYWSILNKYSSEGKDKLQKVSVETFYEHFSKLNENAPENDFGNIDLNNLTEFNMELNAPITIEEISKVILNLKNQKACSINDHVLNEYLKYSKDSMLPIYCKLFNLILNTGIVPEAWSKGTILPIYKNKGDVKDPDNYRGITILSCFGKLFTAVLNQRLNNYLESTGILIEEQAGFRKHYSTANHIFSLKMLIDFYLYKKKRLYCAFIDYRKAFDSVNRVALWRKLLDNNIDGKIFKVIFNIYDNAKSCVKAGGNISMFFSSMAGVRQGENLSPILFSLFLNDLVHFMSNTYSGLATLSQDIGSILNNDDIEVFFKLYLLLYADDTVIFAETPEELQIALDTMLLYCNTWQLQVNTSKTKVVIFSKGKIRRRKPVFYYNGDTIEIVDDFSYLGIKFNYNGKFGKTKKHLVDQARKAMFSLIMKARKLFLPLDIQLHLFDSMITPILLYGAEVWGCENVDIIDKFYLKYCKSLLDVKQATPSVMIHGELGTMPLHLKIKSRVLNFWYRIVSGKNDKICYKLYQLMHYLHVNDLFHSDWIKTVHDTLNHLGLSDMWLSHDTFYSQAAFKNKIKSRLNDQYKQEWKSKIDESEKCLNYRLYKKELKFESYLNILSLPLAKYICKFRCLSHKLPIERGRFLNIDRNERICQLCNKDELGDEFHYLFCCDFFNSSRRKFLPTWSLQSPNTLKLEQLMTSIDRSVLTKLALFIKIVLTKFK